MMMITTFNQITFTQKDYQVILELGTSLILVSIHKEIFSFI